MARVATARRNTYFTRPTQGPASPTIRGQSKPIGERSNTLTRFRVCTIERLVFVTADEHEIDVSAIRAVGEMSERFNESRQILVRAEAANVGDQSPLAD